MWKVVAADDEGYIREALKKLINWEKMDCNLIEVLEDGQELIECIEKESPDIVITDIQMPEVNGLDVCKYLYETRPETQVIILTAYSNFDYAKSAIKFFNRNLFLFAILGTLTFKNEHDSMKSVSEKIQFQAEISGKYNVVIFYRVIA